MQTRKSVFTIGATIVLAFCSATSAQKAETQAPPVAAKPDTITYLPPNQETYLKFADETDSMLRRDVLDVWFPRTVDNQNGGFYSNFTRDWQPDGSQGKFSVFQGRRPGSRRKWRCVILN